MNKIFLFLNSIYFTIVRLYVSVFFLGYFIVTSLFVGFLNIDKIYFLYLQIFFIVFFFVYLFFLNKLISINEYIADITKFVRFIDKVPLKYFYITYIVYIIYTINLKQNLLLYLLWFVCLQYAGIVYGHPYILIFLISVERFIALIFELFIVCLEYLFYLHSSESNNLLYKKSFIFLEIKSLRNFEMFRIFGFFFKNMYKRAEEVKETNNLKMIMFTKKCNELLKFGSNNKYFHSSPTLFYPGTQQVGRIGAAAAAATVAAAHEYAEYQRQKKAAEEENKRHEAQLKHDFEQKEKDRQHESEEKEKDRQHESEEREKDRQLQRTLNKTEDSSDLKGFSSSFPDNSKDASGPKVLVDYFSFDEFLGNFNGILPSVLSLLKTFINFIREIKF